MDTIKALKKNERPFGLMTAEMQAKAKEIGIGEFWVYIEFGQNQMTSPAVWGKHPDRFNWGETVKLRPDYEPKPEIVECEVKANRHGLHFVDDEGRCLGIGMAINYPDFIGFKYAGGVVSTSPRHYYDGIEGEQTWQIYESKLLTKYEVLTPTHVLFSKKG
jgi:hypothetical protein